MKKTVLFLTGLICVFAESIFSQEAALHFSNHDYVFVLHIMLFFLVFLAIMGNWQLAVVFGATYGLIFDMMYVGVLGIYFTIVPLIVYGAYFVSRSIHDYLIFCSGIAWLSIGILELVIYGAYRFLQMVHMPFMDFLTNRFIPTMLFNFAIIVLFSFPFEKWIKKLSIEKF